MLEQVLEPGGDLRMLLSIREMYPDPEIPILNTRDPVLGHRVCTIWDTWYSNIGRMKKPESTSSKLCNAKPMVPTPEEEPSDEESEDEDPNPYTKSTLEERLGVITSRGVTDVNDVVCDFMRMHGFLPQELRKFIEVNGIQHMKKVRGNINFRGPHEHIIWLINLCVDLGYVGRRLVAGSPYIEPGVIHYKYPSTYDPEVACWMYFEGF